MITATLVYRDCDQRLRLRKVVIEMWNGAQLLDRTRMFAGPLFAARLKLRVARMTKRAAVMWNESEIPPAPAPAVAFGMMKGPG